MRISDLTETYVNAIGNSPLKARFVDQVWDILQSSYASLGGIRGSGFDSKEALMQLPFWKILVKDQQVKAVIIYKDSNGRKTVAIGSDGSHYAKKALRDIFKQDMSRAYGEQSKSALGFTMKSMDWNTLSKFVRTPEEAEKIIGKAVVPVRDVPLEDLPPDAQLSLKNYPMLLNYGYLRKLGPELIFKEIGRAHV
jgi:hypothetical protein